MLPPYFEVKAFVKHFLRNFVRGLDADNDWFVKLKCCLYLPLAEAFKAIRSNERAKLGILKVFSYFYFQDFF
jgi:hypothetical protein